MSVCMYVDDNLSVQSSLLVLIYIRLAFLVLSLPIVDVQQVKQESLQALIYLPNM